MLQREKTLRTSCKVQKASQEKKDKSCRTNPVGAHSLYEVPGRVQFIGTECGVMVPEAGRRPKEDLVVNEDRGSALQGEEVLETDGGDRDPTVQPSLCHLTGHLKMDEMVSFTACF